MRNHLLGALSVMLSVTTGFAQITVQSTFIATLGDTVILAEDTGNASQIDIGNAAGSQTWDFSMLEEHLPDGAILELPSTAPLSSNFPDADFVINDIYEDSVHIFFKQSASALDIVGFVEYDSTGSPILPEFSFEQRYMQFPSSFEDEFMSSSFAFEQVEFLGIDPDSIGPHPTIDSLRAKIYFEAHSVMDAWGDLELPGGTFEALRQRSFTVGRIESDWYGNGQWRPFSESFILSSLDSVQYDTNAEETYRWWTNDGNVNFWLVEVEVDSNGNVRDSISFFNGMPEPPLGLNDKDLTRVQLFPNPANAELHISNISSAVRNLSIVDVQGRVVLSQGVSGAAEKLDISSIPSGFYLLTLQNDQGILHFERFEVLH